MRLLGLVVELMKRSWTCLSRQKVEKLSKVEKPQKSKKSAKAVGLEEQTFLTSDTSLSFIKIGSRYTKLTTFSSSLIIPPTIQRSEELKLLLVCQVLLLL